MIVMQVLQKSKENLLCVLSPRVGIVIEEKKSNVGFEPP